VKEPLPPATVKRLLVELRAAGILSFTKHAYEEMAKDNLTEIDVRNTLRGGTVRPGELVSGTWRYVWRRAAWPQSSRSGQRRTRSW
jgi:hypothetical protein